MRKSYRSAATIFVAAVFVVSVVSFGGCGKPSTVELPLPVEKVAVPESFEIPGLVSNLALGEDGDGGVVAEASGDSLVVSTIFVDGEPVIADGAISVALTGVGPETKPTTGAETPEDGETAVTETSAQESDADVDAVADVDAEADANAEIPANALDGGYLISLPTESLDGSGIEVESGGETYQISIVAFAPQPDENIVIRVNSDVLLTIEVVGSSILTDGRFQFAQNATGDGLAIIGSTPIELPAEDEATAESAAEVEVANATEPTDADAAGTAETTAVIEGTPTDAANADVTADIDADASELVTTPPSEFAGLPVLGISAEFAKAITARVAQLEAALDAGELSSEELEKAVAELVGLRDLYAAIADEELAAKLSETAAKAEEALANNTASSSGGSANTGSGSGSSNASNGESSSGGSSSSSSSSGSSGGDTSNGGSSNGGSSNSGTDASGGSNSGSTTNADQAAADKAAADAAEAARIAAEKAAADKAAADAETAEERTARIAAELAKWGEEEARKNGTWMGE